MQPEFEVAIVGTGFAGLGMAINLKKQGKESFVVLERANEVGGTWRENHYPGCACDIPSHLYSFSFEPNPHWTRMFAPQREILEYLKRCADKYDVRKKIRFGSEVERAEWIEDGAFWRVTTKSGTVTARNLVFGIGALSRPATPHLPGIENFRGKTFHSANWDHRYDLTGKNVAVVGTGASAIQFVPMIADQVRRMYVFQRTPPWILPHPDRATRSWERLMFSALPVTQRLYRYLIYWLNEARALGFTVDPRIMQLVSWIGRKHIERQIADPVLRKRVTPTYTPGCKRILMSNTYYRALARHNVELVTEPVGEITEDAVGGRKVDAIIYGTGFRVNDLLTPMEVKGRGGVDLNEAWKNRVSAYLGTTVAGFPNFYMLMGPNTGLGHNSMVFMIEAQIAYSLRCMAAAAKRGATAVEVRPEAQEAFVATLDPRLSHAVWASGCQSWYLDDKGQNSTLWPGFTFEYWLRTLRVRTADYTLRAA